MTLAPSMKFGILRMISGPRRQISIFVVVFIILKNFLSFGDDQKKGSTVQFTSTDAGSTLLQTAAHRSAVRLTAAGGSEMGKIFIKAFVESRFLLQKDGKKFVEVVFTRLR